MNVDELDIEDIKAELEARGTKYHHRAGEDTLRKLLVDTIEGNLPVQDEVKVEESVQVKKEPKKLTKEQEAMKLVRIMVSPNDTVKAGLPGLIFTVCSSAINRGRAIKKYVPFNNEEGWHVPNIIYQQIKNAEMQKFKPVKMPNGESVLQPYITKMYNVEVLEPLTKSELDKLAASQKARGDT